MLRSHLLGILFYILFYIHEFSCAAISEFCGSGCGWVALVPARGGSKGLPNKNVALLGNNTLLNNTLGIIKSSNVFESVWVSTDSEYIAEIAESAQVNVHWRAPETATDTASTLSAVHDFLAYHPDIQILAVIQCTSPFLCSTWLQDAAVMMKDFNTDCVFSVTRSFKLRWKLMSDGYAEADNFSPSKRPRRQDWHGEIYENGMFYFFRRSLAENGKIQSNRCRVVEVPNSRSLEIDKAVDLQIAEAMLKVIDPCPQK